MNDERFDSKKASKDGRRTMCVGFTGGFDDAVLVGLGGIAVPFTVSEPLHHLLRSSEPSTDVADKIKRRSRRISVY